MVRLITVVGHGVNLLPHFIKHYKRYVDEIDIIAVFIFFAKYVHVFLIEVK